VLPGGNHDGAEEFYPPPYGDFFFPSSRLDSHSIVCRSFHASMMDADKASCFPSLVVQLVSLERLPFPLCCVLSEINVCGMHQIHLQNTLFSPLPPDQESYQCTPLVGSSEVPFPSLRFHETRGSWFVEGILASYDYPYGKWSFPPLSPLVFLLTPLGWRPFPPGLG